MAEQAQAKTLKQRILACQYNHLLNLQENSGNLVIIKWQTACSSFVNNLNHIDYRNAKMKN